MPQVLGFKEATPRVGGFKRFSRVFFGRGVVIYGTVIILILIMSAIFAPLISPYDPYEPDIDNAFLKPGFDHPLGTDSLGRDVLSRIIFGARTALIVGVAAIALAAMFGMTLGLIAAYFGGSVYTVIMRFMDTLMSVPLIMLALAIAALLGGGLRNVVIALAVALLPTYARMMCGQALSIKENDYITASKAIGAGNLRIMLRHIAPNCFPPLIVLMTMQIGHAILSEAGLSYLGVGIEPPGAAWGAMVSNGYKHLYTDPLLSILPGIAIMLVVFAFNMVGDGLRDALDPRLRGSL